MSHVKELGAIGDGVNDDTDAIRHCLEQGHGAALFSRGNYRVTKTIEVELSKRGRTAISGDGGMATLAHGWAGAGAALRHRIQPRPRGGGLRGVASA